MANGQNPVAEPAAADLRPVQRGRIDTERDCGAAQGRNRHPLPLSLAAAVLGAALLLTACGDPAADYEKARQAGTEAALLAFEKEYPDSPLAKEAKAQRAELAYQAAIKSNQPADMESFLARFPNSAQAAAETAYRRAASSDAPDAMRLFRQQYPNSRRCSEEKGVELRFTSGIMMSFGGFFGGGGGGDWSRAPDVGISIKTSSNEALRMKIPISEARAIGVFSGQDSMAMSLPQPVSKTKKMDVVLCLRNDGTKVLVAANSSAPEQPESE